MLSVELIAAFNIQRSTFNIPVFSFSQKIKRADRVGPVVIAIQRTIIDKGAGWCRSFAWSSSFVSPSFAEYS
jgi:hypothetical protein